jgi:HSP20 family protein
MNDLFEQAMARTNFEASEEVEGWTPVCDVYETASSLVVRIELPGMSQDEIDLKIEDDRLTLAGERQIGRPDSGERYHRVERSQGRFSRGIPLPAMFDRDAVRAAYQDGVLTVEIGKRTPGRADSIRVSID